MITPNHGLSGYVCGRALLPLLRRFSPLGERAVGWAFFLGAMLPDADILTKAIGGRSAYFSEAFYAHRHASHSLLGGAVLAVVAAWILFHPLTGLGGRLGPRFWRGGQGGSSTGQGRAFFWLALCFWLGTVLHLVGDFFTPGWPLPILWPYPERWGGLSHIGWFTPYLLWLFVSTLALGWALEALRTRVREGRGIFSGGGWSPWRPRAVWLGAAGWLLYSVAATRWVQFMVVSRYESWSQWHAFQRSLLPEAMIVPVTDGVRTVWSWLTG